MQGSLRANQRDTLILGVTITDQGQPVPLGGYDIEAQMVVNGQTYDLAVTRGDVGELDLRAPSEAVDLTALARVGVSLFSDGIKQSSWAFLVELRRFV